MTDAAAPAPVRGSWRRLALGLGAFLFAPLVPALRAAMPIEQTPMLVVVMVAVCSIVAWRNGGRLVLALLWVGIAAFVLISLAGPSDSPHNWLA